MEGVALAAILPPWSYNAQTESLPSPSLQKVTILAKAINRNKPFALHVTICL